LIQMSQQLHVMRIVTMGGKVPPAIRPSFPLTALEALCHSYPPISEGISSAC
jgi:hypothetical protein